MYFSIKMGTIMAYSPVSLLKWLYAIYSETVPSKRVSSMQLHRDLGVTPTTAWYMQQRIREAFAKKPRKKVLKADYRGATTEQVVKAVLQYRPKEAEKK